MLKVVRFTKGKLACILYRVFVLNSKLCYPELSYRAVIIRIKTSSFKSSQVCISQFLVKSHPGSTGLEPAYSSKTPSLECATLAPNKGPVV